MAETGFLQALHSTVLFLESSYLVSRLLEAHPKEAADLTAST